MKEEDYYCHFTGEETESPFLQEMCPKSPYSPVVIMHLLGSVLPWLLNVLKTLSWVEASYSDCGE